MTSHSKLSDYSTTSHLIAWTADGNHFLYEGETSNGSGLLVSDGTTEWHLRRSFAQYDKSPAGTFFKRPNVMGGDDDVPYAARRLLTQITQMHGGVDLARFAPSESLEYRGHKVRCTVVQFEFKRTVDRDPNRPIQRRNTIWINPANLVVLKIEYRDRYRMMQGMVTPPQSEWHERFDQTVFTVADLDPPIPDNTFSFTSAPGVAEVASLPALFPPPGTQIVGPSPATAQYVGKRLPNIVVHDGTGKDVSLARYSGHPMLIDLWATWCGPCIHDMPVLGKLKVAAKARKKRSTTIKARGGK